jgi:AraC-like DNA-binding protein
MDSATIHQHFYFAVFVLFAFVGVLQLTFKRKLQLNFFLAGLFLAGGYNVLYFWAYSLGLLRYAPLLLNTEISAAFLIGPFLYLYFSALTDTHEIPRPAIAIHTVPAILSLLFFLASNAVDESVAADYGAQLSVLPDYSYNRAVFLINLICDLSIAVYFALAAYKTSLIMRTNRGSREVRTIVFFLVAFPAAAMSLFLASVTQNTALMVVSIVSLSILPTAFVVFSFRHPDYAIRVIKEARVVKGGGRRPLSRDLPAVLAELDRVVCEEKTYRDPELSLQTLSRRLSLTPHELSYILNTELHQNFRSYLNSCRINEAKILLIEDPDRSVLEVAFAVGFNSTSSFYEHFKHVTGLAPREFRKAASAKSG